MRSDGEMLFTLKGKESKVLEKQSPTIIPFKKSKTGKIQVCALLKGSGQEELERDTTYTLVLSKKDDLHCGAPKDVASVEFR